MGKNLSPKCKQCRRAGEKLMLKGERCNSPKCAMVKRNYPPGLHGPKRAKRKSDYGIQLAEKQKAKKYYNVLEKQFKLTFERVGKQKGDTGVNLLKALEMRLDNVVHKGGFASSRSQARQLVNHAHFTLNSKKVNIPSISLKEGDVIEIKKNSRNDKFFRELAEKIKSYTAPGWLHLDVKEMKIKVLHAPKENDLPKNINTQMIVEYYSK